MRRVDQLELTCNVCLNKFNSWVHNARYCVSCKTLGIYFMECGHCKVEFRTKRKGVKYCNTCSSEHSYLRGKTRSKEIVDKVTSARLKWVRSESGKDFYKKLGMKNSENLKKYFKTTEGREQIKRVSSVQSKVMKNKILNGEFTPNITNSFTHWVAEVEYNGQIKKFRSSWEACFWLSNPCLEYETIRIPLKSGGCVITDFLDSDNRIIYEIKPTSFWRKQQNKIDAIIEYCLENTYKFIWVNERNILGYIDLEKFVGDINQKQLEVMLNGIKGHTNQVN
jgi:hypothetical protein